MTVLLSVVLLMYLRGIACFTLFSTTSPRRKHSVDRRQSRSTHARGYSVNQDLRTHRLRDSHSNDLPSSLRSYLDTKQAEENQILELDFPWNQVQTWALRDNICRFTVQVPIIMNDGRTRIKVCTFWRSLSEDVPELSGYPLTFLIDRYKELRSKRNQTVAVAGEEILPYLDSFEFLSSGGVSGCVYGMPGVADGARIETAPVGDVQLTVPNRFVMTLDSSIIYELGRPIEEKQVYSLNGKMKSIATSRDGRRINTKTSDSNEVDSLLDPDIVNLSALTILLIGGAVAFQALSHHLTVNVFWV